MGIWPLPECQRVSFANNLQPCGQPQRAARGAPLRRALLSSTTRWRLALPFVVGPMAVAQAALAHDGCSIMGSRATCTGDQGGGRAFHDGSGITTLNIQVLTTPIQPPSGTSGIVLDQTGASAFPLSGGNGTAGSPLTVTTDATVN